MLLSTCLWQVLCQHQQVLVRSAVQTQGKCCSCSCAPVHIRGKCCRGWVQGLRGLQRVVDHQAGRYSAAWRAVRASLDCSPIGLNCVHADLNKRGGRSGSRETGPLIGDSGGFGGSGGRGRGRGRARGRTGGRVEDGGTCTTGDGSGATNRGGGGGSTIDGGGSGGGGSGDTAAPAVEDVTLGAQLGVLAGEGAEGVKEVRLCMDHCICLHSECLYSTHMMPYKIPLSWPYITYMRTYRTHNC